MNVTAFHNQSGSWGTWGCNTVSSGSRHCRHNIVWPMNYTDNCTLNAGNSVPSYMPSMTQCVIRAFNHPLICIQRLRKYQPLQFGKLYWNGTFPTEHYSSHTAHPHLCMWALSLLHVLHLFQSLFSVTSNVLGAENEGSWEAITSTVHGLLDMIRLINCCWVHAISPHYRTTQVLMLLCPYSIPPRDWHSLLLRTSALETVPTSLRTT